MIKVTSSTQLANYGVKGIKNRISKFNNGFERFNTFNENKIKLLNQKEIIKQYEEFKRIIRNEYSNLESGVIYSKILRSPFYFDLKRLIEICLVIPNTSVECERSFSQMNIIKSILRTRMEEDTRDCLMAIKLNEESLEEFDFATAFLSWKLKFKIYFI